MCHNPQTQGTLGLVEPIQCEIYTGIENFST